MNWEELSNSEIEIKLKEIEFEYNKISNEINEKYSKLNELNKNYIKGKYVIDKRLKPSKFN